MASHARTAASPRIRYSRRPPRSNRGVGSHSRFGSNPAPILEKETPFFSCTYVEPILQPLCFQIRACNGGYGVPSDLRPFQRFNDASIYPLSFHVLAHSFPQRPSVNPLLINNFRTLFIATGVPPSFCPLDLAAGHDASPALPPFLTSLSPYLARRSWRGRMLGQRAKTEVVRPPRGVNSPRTTHHLGRTAATMSRRILFTAFS